jgi:hypothetical protein
MLSLLTLGRLTTRSLYNIARFFTRVRDDLLIALGRAAPYIDTHRQADKFARDLRKNRRHTEVPVSYSRRPVPSAGTLKTLKI